MRARARSSYSSMSCSPVTSGAPSEITWTDAIYTRRCSLVDQHSIRDWGLEGRGVGGTNNEVENRAGTMSASSPPQASMMAWAVASEVMSPLSIVTPSAKGTDSRHVRACARECARECMGTVRCLSALMVSNDVKMSRGKYNRYSQSVQ